jgi:hypothetical protein
MGGHDMTPNTTSPRPWYVSPAGGSEGAHIATKVNGFSRLLGVFNRSPLAEDQANAELTVLAVNERDGLLADRDRLARIVEAVGALVRNDDLEPAHLIVGRIGELLGFRPLPLEVGETAYDDHENAWVIVRVGGEWVRAECPDKVGGLYDILVTDLHRAILAGPTKDAPHGAGEEKR